jgi:hypothetical protein
VEAPSKIVPHVLSLNAENRFFALKRAKALYTNTKICSMVNELKTVPLIQVLTPLYSGWTAL